MKKDIIHKKCGKKIEECNCKDARVKIIKKEKDYHAKLVIEGLPTLSENRVRMVCKWLEDISRVIKKQLKEDPKMYAKIARWKLMK